MDLILVRHARPEQVTNVAGGADPALTDIGHRQARAVAAWLAAEEIDGLYSSPMVRARETAAPLERLLGVDAAVIEGVQEYDAGEASYTPIEVMQQDPEVWRRYVEEEKTLDRSDWAKVVGDALDDIIGRHRSQRAVVVCHGGVINVWAAVVLGLTPSMFFNPNYTSINRFRIASTGERSIVSLNETPHLRGAPDLQLY